MDGIRTRNKWGQCYQNISYRFDAAGNVLGYENDCLDAAGGNYRTSQTYGYDAGGQVASVTGSHFGHEFNYVTNILYDEHGQRTRIDYGNGTFTEYEYDPARRWLDSIRTRNKWGQNYQNISYRFDAVGNVLGYENDCMDTVSGNYKTKQDYSYDSLYQLIRVDGATAYNPHRSAVPEFASTYSQVFEFDADGLGNMVSKTSAETVSPRKSIGDSLNYQFDYVYDENYAHRLVRAGDRRYEYDANGNVICEQDGDFESGGDTAVYRKVTKEAEDVYSTDYGWGLFKEEDKSGNASATRYRRTYAWDERNRLISSVDANCSTSYVYGHDGQRSNKYTHNSETLYFSKMWSLHTDSGNNVYGGQSAKSIYLGDTRIVTKLNSGSDPTYQEECYKQYYYHGDHLGSASLISDYKGDEYQRIEYTPYGETWVEKTSNTGLEFLPYKFTAKELDKETGLYYYGARYLDPKYSRWMSTDPALGEYLADSGKSSSGGIYNCKNFNLYHYANNNPIKYTDPDGKDAYLVVWATGIDVGHAGFAVDNYDENGNAAGTVTYYDLWPRNTVNSNKVSEDVEANYNKYTISLEDLKTGLSIYFPDERNADGIIKFTTDKKTDDSTKKKFDKFMETKIYNGEKRNCSDMAKVGVKNSGQGKKFGIGKENVFFIKTFTTPNKLFNDSKKMNNATILLDPDEKTNYSFSRNIVKPEINAYINNLITKPNGKE